MLVTTVDNIPQTLCLMLMCIWTKFPVGWDILVSYRHTSSRVLQVEIETRHQKTEQNTKGNPQKISPKYTQTSQQNHQKNMGNWSI